MYLFSRGLRIGRTELGRCESKRRGGESGRWAETASCDLGDRGDGSEMRNGARGGSEARAFLSADDS